MKNVFVITALMFCIFLGYSQSNSELVVQENDLELVGKPTGTAIFKIKVLNENNEVIVLPDYIEEGVTLSGSFDSLDKICADLEKTILK